MKRWLLALFVLVTAVPAHAQDKLVVSIWGGSWRDLVAETVAKKFTAETGVPVEFITGGTIDRLNKATLAKGNPESDLTFTTSHVGWIYATDGLFEELDATKIPNAENLADEYRAAQVAKAAFVHADPRAALRRPNERRRVLFRIARLMVMGVNRKRGLHMAGEADQHEHAAQPC